MFKFLTGVYKNHKRATVLLGILLLCVLSLKAALTSTYQKIDIVATDGIGTSFTVASTVGLTGQPTVTNEVVDYTKVFYEWTAKPTWVGETGKGQPSNDHLKPEETQSSSHTFVVTHAATNAGGGAYTMVICVERYFKMRPVGSSETDPSVWVKCPLGSVKEEIPVVINFVSVRVNNDRLAFSRGNSYEVPLIITPPSASDHLFVNVSGFDGTHWTASYDSTGKKIDISNLIDKPEIIDWLNEKTLSISVGLDNATNNWPLVKYIDFKKTLYDQSVKKQKDAIDEALSKLSPGTYAKEYVINKLQNISEEDSDGNLQCLPNSLILQIANRVDQGVTSLFTTLVSNYVWDNVPVTSWQKTVDESFNWKITATPSIGCTGGEIVMVNPLHRPGDWVKSFAEVGLSGQEDPFNVQYGMIKASITGDGKTANGELHAEITGFIQFWHKTPSGIEGHFNTGINGSIIYSW